MSSLVLPVFAGLKWDIKQTPRFKTRITESVSMREYRTSYSAYPVWDIKASYEVLRDGSVHGVAYSEVRQLGGFFLNMKGAFDNFLYTNPNDNSVTDQNFGTGNGSTTQFQLARTYGAGAFLFSEPVQNVNVLTNIKVNGVTQTAGANYSINSTGLVTFTTPPTSGHAITWTGTYYYRCRFLEDLMEFNQFMYNLWDLKKLEFRGAPGNKV